ncbi:MAG: MBL fold metallo-hydrolase [Alphaproteobacteria bacterium]|nr:MBL fold metallo-hydrolase [Alphaproteobacteria bacterium]
MTNIILYDDGVHRNVLLPDFDAGGIAVQSNQHLIIDAGEGMVLDPGGHQIYRRVLAQTHDALDGGFLRYIFLSHQDPDIVAAMNGWLMATEATAYISEVWTRFVSHFGMNHFVEDRLIPIPDEGMIFEMGGTNLMAVPAHFMHSVGNFHLYDPISKILYTGDLGTSIGAEYRLVEDFDAHLPHMVNFHTRYMVSNRVMKAWAAMVRSLDIEIIAPQHGALFAGKEMVHRFIDWCADLKCGSDLLISLFKAPAYVQR